MVQDPLFLRAQLKTTENLESLQMNLVQCVEEGMVDFGDTYYNEVLGLIEKAHLSQNWDELLEVITKAKTLEKDVAAWFARHGRTTLSLSWPYPDKRS